MAFPRQRMRRLRLGEGLRRMVRETRLHPASLVMPLFVRAGKGAADPIPSMPGQFRYTPDRLVERCAEIASLGIGGVILFGIPGEKDPRGSGAWAEDGVVQESVRLLKRALPEFPVITDVCLCEYTDHGHCGVVKQDPRSAPSASGGPCVDNDATLDLLAKTAVSHARAGADMVAPSDMMDGRVKAIRDALDAAGFADLPVMSYAAKYCSALYAPFRDAAESAPRFGDRRSYQMDPANAEEALREVALDIEEGADIVIVKPALAFGDVIRRVKEAFGVPVAAFSVSGEYAMVKAAAERGWLDERAAAMELLTGIRRAGAEIILTYWAADAASWL
ncbi:MAG: porphobilinogen synthase [Chlamydiae bacterium]|nr:porphobilinogen synthase [Chlamydiota bacterium]HQM52496.1 porphobilinogen synthase [bacterium]